MKEVRVRITKLEILELVHADTFEMYCIAALREAGIPVKGFFLFDGLLEGTLEREDIPYTGDVVFTWRHEDNGMRGLLVCTKCLIADYHFVGGGSWISDSCPQCGGTDCRRYENLTYEEKLKATEIWERMWREKHSIKEDGEYEE